MAKLLKGAPVAARISEEVLRETTALKAKGVAPTLAIVRVGDKADDVAYERAAIKRCEKTGVRALCVTLPQKCEEEELLAAISKQNADDNIHGILLFRPLPAGINEIRARNYIDPRKDVDGVTDASLAGVFTGSPVGFSPCTAQACMELLDYYDIKLPGRRAVVVGRSLVVGKPLGMLLLNRDATVTVCHSKTKDLAELCRRADVLVACAGKRGVVSAACLSPGQTVLDVGIHVAADGSLLGDVDFEAANSAAASLTPVPGGVGAVTTSVLVKHVAEAAGRLLLEK